MYRILIVEDDASMAKAMKTQIDSWGNQAETVKDFQNVISAFLNFDPHMVLMDIMLPFYNGYHWCSEIRKISNVPVVFISSASDTKFYGNLRGTFLHWYLFGTAVCYGNGFDYLL